MMIDMCMSKISSLVSGARALAGGLAATALVAVSAVPLSAQELETVDSGKTKAIIAHGQCREVTNRFDDSISIPLKSASEWTGTDGFIINAATLSAITIRRCAESTNWWDAAICITTDQGSGLYAADTNVCKTALGRWRVLQQSSILPVAVEDGLNWQVSFEWQEANPGQTLPANMVPACTRSGRALSVSAWGARDPFGSPLSGILQNYQVPSGHPWCIVRIHTYGWQASSGGHESTGASDVYVRLWRQ